MMVAYGQQHFFSIEVPSTYVHPQPGSHANRVGLYSDELMAASNPSIGEETSMEAVLDIVAEKTLPRCHRGGGGAEQTWCGPDGGDGVCLLVSSSLSRCCVNSLYPEQPQGDRKQGKRLVHRASPCRCTTLPALKLSQRCSAVWSPLYPMSRGFSGAGDRSPPHTRSRDDI
jgi:hypothetical protein